MKHAIDELLPVFLIISLIALLPGSAIADSEIKIRGAINEDGQLIGNDGVIYEIAENDMGNELIEMVGKQVFVKGMLMVSDEILLITVINFELLE